MLTFAKRALLLLGAYILTMTSDGSATEVMAGAAQALNFVSSFGGCDSIDEERAQSALAKLRSCTETMRRDSFDDIARLTEQMQPAAESGYLSALAIQHARELACGANFGSYIARGQKGVVRAIAEKLKLMRELRSTWVNSSRDLRSDRTLAGRFCPQTLEELDDPNESPKFKLLCGKSVRAAAAISAIQSSIPLIGDRQIKAMADRFMDSKDEVGDEILEGEIKELYNQASSRLQAQASRLRARAEIKGGDTFTPDEKHELVSDPEVVERVVSQDPSAMKPLECRTNARFGKGRDNLDLTLGVGSLFLGGAALGVAKGAGWASRFSGSVATARYAGQLSTTGVRILRASAVSAAAGSAALAASRICRHSSWKDKVKSKDDCAVAPRIDHIESEACELAATLTALDVASLAPASKLAMLMIPAWAKKSDAAAHEAKVSLKALENQADINPSDWGRHPSRPSGFASEGPQAIPLSREAKDFVRQTSRIANREATGPAKVDRFLQDVGAHASARDFARRNPESIEVQTLLKMIEDVHDPDKIKREVGNLIAATEREGRFNFGKTAGSATQAKLWTKDADFLEKQAEIDKLAEQFKDYRPQRAQDSRFIEIVGEKGAHVERPDALYETPEIHFPTQTSFRSLFLKHTEPHAYGLNEIARFRTLEGKLLAAKTDLEKQAILEEIKKLPIVRKDRPTSFSLLQNQLDLAPDLLSDSRNFRNLNAGTEPAKDHLLAVSFESEVSITQKNGRTSYHPHRYRIAVCNAPAGEHCATAGAQYKSGEVITFYPECGDFVLKAPSFTSLKKHYLSGKGGREITLERVPCVD